MNNRNNRLFFLRHHLLWPVIIVFASILNPLPINAQIPPSVEDIQAIQRLLVQYGYAIDPIDGIAGRQTNQAIQQFQRDHGLAIRPLDEQAIKDIYAVVQPNDVTLQPAVALESFTLPLESISFEQNYQELTNQELLEQATTRYQQEKAHFNAAQRQLQKMRILYRQIEKTNQSAIPTEEITIPKDIIEEAALTQAEAQLQRYQDYLQNLNRQFKTLEQWMQQNDASQRAIEGFINALYKLYPIMLELRLRVNDHTILQKDIPAFLTEQTLATQEQLLQTHKKILSEEQSQNRKIFEVLQTKIEDIQTIVTTAETAFAALHDQQKQVNQQQRLQAMYEQKSDEDLQTEFSRSEDERISLQGAFRLALLRLNKSQEQLDGLESALEPLPSTETQILNSDDSSVAATEAAATALETTITDFEIRLTQLQRFRQSIEQVTKLEQAFAMEASILADHLTKMRLLAELIVKRDSTRSKDLEAIKATQAAIINTIDEKQAMVQTLADQAKRLQTQLEKIRLAYLQAKQQLMDFEQTLASARQAQQWQQQLAELDGPALIEQFTSDMETLASQRDKLAEQQQKIEALQQQKAILSEKLNIINDPLVAMSDLAVQEEKQRIQETLFQLAGLEQPTTTNSMSTTTVSEHAEVVDAKNNKSPSSPDTASQAVSDESQSGNGLLAVEIANLRQYQNLISNRQQSIRSRIDDRLQLLEILQSLDSAQTTYIEQLSEAHRLALQQWATAVELKKQLGRGDLTAEQTPEGLLEALQKAPIEALEQELTTSMNQRAHIRLRIAHLSMQDSTQTPRQELIDQLQSLVGRRLDLLAELQQLEAQRLQKQDNLTEGEQRRLEQQVKNRMAASSSWLESALGFLPSEQAEELTELLRSHYHELITVETKQGLLATEKDKIAYLIQLVQTEQQAIKDFVPLLRERLDVLKQTQDRAWVLLRAQWQPEQAEQILADFAARTGEQLEVAPQILETERAAFVENAMGELLVRHVQILALQQWIARFEQRQSQTLITEIAHYQEREGEISALNSALQRQSKRLLGHTEEELNAQPENQQPTTSVEKAYFLQGEIGVEHENRTQAHLRALLTVIFELTVIIMLTGFILYITKRMVDKKTRQLEMSGAPDSTHALFALSFGFTAFRIIVIILAIVLALSSLGFDIGVILAGLGIGGFAVAIAAKETLSNLIGGITLFIERPFRIGDIVQINNDIKLGDAEIGQVESVSWRTTRIVTVMNYHITMPNSRVAEAAIINHTYQLPLRDLVHVYVSPAYEVRKILLLITSAVDECQLIRQDLQKQILAIGADVVGEIVLTKYEVRWYTDVSYLARARVLTEFWNRLWQKFDESDIPLEYITRSRFMDFKQQAETQQNSEPVHTLEKQP
jgi:small-conductance mechanosensitive channel/peptidoglycan hydrolase-like protein with peptidoglycan-binding domain